MGKNKGIRMRQIEAFLASGQSYAAAELYGVDPLHVHCALRHAVSVGGYPVNVCLDDGMPCLVRRQSHGTV